MAPIRAVSHAKADRRQEIPDAAERCFARSGFHQASMNEICIEAGMSPGNLYRYFPSKEAIIAGIAERNRAEVAETFSSAAKAPDLFEGLRELAQYYIAARTDEKVALCIEILAESRRNPAIAQLSHEIDREVATRLEDMLRTAAARGEIADDIDFSAVVSMMFVLGDGMTWQRAADPNFDTERMLPYMFQMIGYLLRGKASPVGEKSQ